MSEKREQYTTDTDLVRAVQGREMDDQAREDAIAGLRVAIAELVDDYEFAIREAGNLGGVELI